MGLGNSSTYPIKEINITIGNRNSPTRRLQRFRIILRLAWCAFAITPPIGWRKRGADKLHLLDRVEQVVGAVPVFAFLALEDGISTGVERGVMKIGLTVTEGDTGKLRKAGEDFREARA